MRRTALVALMAACLTVILPSASVLASAAPSSTETHSGLDLPSCQPVCAQVINYADANLKGRVYVTGFCDKGKAACVSIPDLTKVGGPRIGPSGLLNWNDCISSVRVENARADRVVHVEWWTNKDYKGSLSNSCVIVGQGACQINQVRLNDQISSIKVWWNLVA